MQAFEPGARLLVVTKGVTESKQGKVAFGADKVREALQRSKDKPASHVCQDVLEAAHGFQDQRSRLSFGRKRVVMREDMTALAMVRSF